MSKCACCDRHNATVYYDDDMYCTDCYAEKHYDEHVCYCDSLSEYDECMHCRQGERPHNPWWD